MIKLQKLSSVIYEAITQYSEPNEHIKSIVSALSSAVSCSCLLVNADGGVLEYAKLKDLFSLSLMVNEKEKSITPVLNGQFKSIVETKNISLSSLYIKNISKPPLSQYHAMIIPIICANQRMGSLLIYRKDLAFSPEDSLLAQITQSFLAVTIYGINERENLIKARNEESVKGALDTLSYSELEAVIYVIGHMQSDEGLIVASKIANKYNLTRSVIVNGMRKLESASLIESRSLGMKGTYIKILNKKLVEELNKLSNLQK